MARATKMAIVGDRELKPLTAAAVSPGAGTEHEQVADQIPSRAVQRRADEVMVGACQERDLASLAAQERVGIVAEPVLVVR